MTHASPAPSRLENPHTGEVPELRRRCEWATILMRTSLICPLVVVLFMLAPIARGETPGGTSDEIVGTWRGSSVCVDRQAAPACNDEQVVYEIRGMPGKPNMVTVKADKIVDGKRVPMGDLDFTHEAKSNSWITEFENPRVHALWRLAVSGTTMTGTMMLLPSKVVVRRMDLRKSMKSELYVHRAPGGRG